MRGKAALAIRTGLFIREYLEDMGEATITEMHHAYKDAWRGENMRRPRDRRVKPATWRSFYVYFKQVVRLGLVRECGEREAEMKADPRVFSFVQDGQVRTGAISKVYCLTEHGRGEEDAWRRPSAYTRAGPHSVLDIDELKDW